MVAARNVIELLGLAHVHERGDAPLLPGLGEPHIVGAGGQGLPRDLQLQIQFPQFEVGAGHVADEGQDDGRLKVFRRQQLGPCRLGGSPETPPDIQLPRDAQPGLGEEGLVERRPVAADELVERRRRRRIGGGELE